MKRAAALLVLLCSACHHAVRITPPRAGATQSDWLDLQPAMQIRIQNAYYRDGFPKHGVDGYLGTETAHFEVRTRGIRLLSVEDLLKPHPREQAPVPELIPASHRGFAHYRYFYAVVFNHRGNLRGSVLLGAASIEEIERLGEKLVSDPDSVCGGDARRCTVFPETCTVSIEIEVTVNSAPRLVFWGSWVANVAAGAHQIELRRRGGVSLKIDPADYRAMHTPLLPGDRLTWN
jgi:hypothetical protein